MEYRIVLKLLKGNIANEEVVFEENGPCVVGRSSECAFCIPPECDPGISRWHCLFIIEIPKLYIRDLGSRNGTYVNNMMLPPGELGEGEVEVLDTDYELTQGDIVRIGSTIFEFTVDPPLKKEERKIPTNKSAVIGQQVSIGPSGTLILKPKSKAEEEEYSDGGAPRAPLQAKLIKQGPDLQEEADQEEQDQEASQTPVETPSEEPVEELPPQNAPQKPVEMPPEEPVEEPPKPKPIPAKMIKPGAKAHVDTQTGAIDMSSIDIEEAKKNLEAQAAAQGAHEITSDEELVAPPMEAGDVPVNPQSEEYLQAEEAAFEGETEEEPSEGELSEEVEGTEEGETDNAGEEEKPKDDHALYNPLNFQASKQVTRKARITIKTRQ